MKQFLLRMIRAGGDIGVANRHIHQEDTQNDFHIRIIRAANGYVVHGNKHDNNGNCVKDELHIVGSDENLMDTVAKVVVAMQMG
jgi:hypothetical protein